MNEYQLASTQEMLAPYPLIHQASEIKENLAVGCKIVMDARKLADLEQIAIGAYAPLQGFLEEADYHEVCLRMHLTTGEIWPIPITLAVYEQQAAHLAVGQTVLLVGESGVLQGRMTLTSIYRPDKRQEALDVYGTTDRRHPGVRYLLESGPVYLGGPIEMFRLPSPELGGLPWLPSQVMQEIRRRGWRRVVGFQTRNPMHRAHEYIQKSALETMDGLLLQPLVGPTKADDVPVSVRIATYHAVVDHWYPPKRVILAAHTGAMRYAGPKEAVLHALVRRNFGCTHFIVGRDHGGVGNFYGPYDGHRIFDRLDPSALGITPLFFEDAFYCRSCSAMGTAKSCPHEPAVHVALSGTELRRRLNAGEEIPTAFMRPEVARILQHYYQAL